MTRNLRLVDTDDELSVGDPVQVHVAYNDAWVNGYEVAAVVAGGYQVRRVADGFMLPSPTGPSDVRRRRDRF